MLTDEEKKEATAIRLAKWQKDNKDKVVANRRRYYKKHKNDPEYKKKAVARARQYRIDNLDKVNAKRAVQRAGIRDVLAKKQREYYARNRDRLLIEKSEYQRTSPYVKQYRKRVVRELPDTYVRELLGSRSSIPNDMFPQELVDFKRAKVILNRLIKERQKK